MTNETRQMIGTAARQAVFGGVPSIDVYAVNHRGSIIRFCYSLRTAVKIAKSFRNDGPTIIVDTRNGTVVFSQK